MKIRVTVKDPDGLYDALKDAGLDPNDAPTVFANYFEYGEYLYLEFDTEEHSARVLPRSEWR